MKRTHARHILILVALLHLLSDAALAGSLVFCVGPDDHRALEVEHLGTAGCETSTSATSGDAALDSAPGDCADSPLHPEADIATGNQDWERVSPPLLAVPSPLVSGSCLERPASYARARAADVAPDLLVQRNTVLLL